MSTRVLLTGASGYIGGTLLKRLLASPLLSSITLFALVRTPAQSKKVKLLGDVTPLTGDHTNPEGLRALVVDNQITIVIETTDAMTFVPGKAFIEGLAAVRATTGDRTHFFHTSGAKLFSSLTGADGTVPTSDAGDVYDLQRQQKTAVPELRQVLPINLSVIDFAEANDVRSYVIVPPMVYGPGEGFGNKTSIQIVGLFKIVRSLRKVYQIDPTSTSWILCHILDLTSLYLTVLSAIIASGPSSPSPPFGKQGFYFAENGRFKWTELSQAIAKEIGGIDITVVPATEEDLEKMGEVLGSPSRFVSIAVAGSCFLKGDTARALGWKPVYDAQHLFSDAGVGGDTLLMMKEIPE